MKANKVSHEYIINPGLTIEVTHDTDANTRKVYIRTYVDGKEQVIEMGNVDDIIALLTKISSKDTAPNITNV